MKQWINKVLRLWRQDSPTQHAPRVVEQYGERKILEATAGNEAIKQKLIAGEPFVAGKLGSVELLMLLNERAKKWDKQVLQALSNNAGFFPTSEASCLQLAEVYKKTLAEIDTLAVWFNEGEETIVQQHSPQAELVRLRSLEPYYHENPWSEALAGKTVLVVHPFIDSIVMQYEKKHTKLFANERVLPTFTLKTLRAVQSIADNKQHITFQDWFEALAYMQQEMEKIAFDVAIIGAGAYGLPLAGFAKAIGRQAIHMGGATQLLFGIFGNRWEQNEIIKGFQNDYWTRPSPAERPQGAERVEGACYW